MSLALSLTKWLAPAAALFALACALLAPAEASGARQRGTHRSNSRVQPEAKPSPPAAQSTVRGRVVYDDTTRPVRRARVMLVTSAVGRSEHVALTDARGDFRIRGVPAGSYYAYVDMPGILSPVGFVNIERARAASGLSDLGEGRRFFDVIEVDGKQDLNVTVHARRGAAIAGRVSYADGDPAVNVHINLMRRSADGRVEKYMPGMTVVALAGPRTDDRGVFRLSGLPPGEYLVGVTELIQHGGEGVGESSVVEEAYTAFHAMFAQHLLMTFYPSATGAKEAAVIKVEAGEERADVDITIPERDLRTVDGVVRARRGGAPVSGARVSIARRDDPLALSGPMAAYAESLEQGTNSTTTDEQGRWQLVEIPDGDYVISVRPPRAGDDEEAPVPLDPNAAPPDEDEDGMPPASGHPAAQRPARPKHFYAPTRANLGVSGGDVSEFVVEVGEGARVAGTVTVEGRAKPAYWHVSVMRVGDGGTTHEEGEAEVMGTRGGRFAVEGLSAGKFLIQPTLVGGGDDEDEELYLKSITWNGRDLLRTPLELAEGASAEGVRIVYGRNPATLHVTVRGAAGRRQAEEFAIAVVPADLSAWSPYGEHGFCLTEGGTCEVSAPPGEYRVLAMRPPEGPDDYEQEVRRRAPNAVRVTLREGETSRVEVDAPGN